MADFKIETKPAFTVLGLGTILSGEYAQLGAQKAAFWQQVGDQAAFVALGQTAINEKVFAVNEAINNEFHYYAGRQTAADVQVDNADLRAIQFPAGDYLVVTATAPDQMSLFNTLEGLAFGKVLPTLTDYAYVGGPNTAVMTDQQATSVSGEMLIPLTHK